MGSSSGRCSLSASPCGQAHFIQANPPSYLFNHHRLRALHVYKPIVFPCPTASGDMPHPRRQQHPRRILIEKNSPDCFISWGNVRNILCYQVGASQKQNGCDLRLEDSEVCSIDILPDLAVVFFKLPAILLRRPCWQINGPL